jgi:uncharacterized Zn ribbon protein
MAKCIRCKTEMTRDMKRCTFYCPKCNETFSDTYIEDYLFHMWLQDKKLPFIFR